MEHLLHLFGGGCGEHMLWPLLMTSGSGLILWVRCKFKKLTKRSNITLKVDPPRHAKGED